MLSERHSHSSCVINEKLYILGSLHEEGYCNTIELINADVIIRHHAGETASLPTWEKIELQTDFTQRLYPLFAPFEQDKIIILGGPIENFRERACFKSLKLDMQGEAFAFGRSISAYRRSTAKL